MLPCRVVGRALPADDDVQPVLVARQLQWEREFVGGEVRVDDVVHGVVLISGFDEDSL